MIHICYIVVILVLLFVINNLLKKYERAADESSRLGSVLDYFRSKTKDTYKTMRKLDEKQMFESDDEVGTIFNQLKSLVYELNNIL
jgi:hypothetical protein|tara:strand:+ start:385 stop:642 length:258 start_codon:yes stop_codon:yes gene_type:complete